MDKNLIKPTLESTVKYNTEASYVVNGNEVTVEFMCSKDTHEDFRKETIKAVK